MRSATVVLPVPGLPVKGHVQRRRIRRQAELLAGPLDEQQRRDVADAVLDRREPDELAVELVEHLGDADFELLAQIDGLRGSVRLRHGL